MITKLPEVKHIYQNHHLDSTRWEYFSPRDDDIVIATPYKSGTTWMQNIIMNLIFQDLEIRKAGEYSPWLDNCRSPLDEVIEKLEAQEHRRFIKSHLPLDGLPFYSQVKYIVVGRDGRDVFMSMWNHYRNFTDEFLETLNETGFPFIKCPDDIRELWQMWITKGYFEWETEGSPFWSNFRHVQTWWNIKDLPNVLFVHYSDLLADLEGELRRIIAYLDMDVPDDILLKIADAVTFKTMKQNAEKLMTMGVLKGGANTFINKGTNGRWREVLTEDDLKLYEAAKERELTPDCVEWLENGRIVEG